MSRRPWMPLYTADYHRDTRHLSVAEHGAYLLLIMEYWDKGTLPQDEKQIMRVACCEHQEWEVIRNAIIPFFDSNWKHKRIEQELKKYEQRAAGNKQKAVKAAQTRWQNHSSGNASGNAPSIPPSNAPRHARDMPTQKSDLKTYSGTTSEHLASAKPNGGSLATAPDGGALRSPPPPEPAASPEEATEKANGQPVPQPASTRSGQAPITASPELLRTRIATAPLTPAEAAIGRPPTQLTRAEYDAMLVKRRYIS